MLNYYVLQLETCIRSILYKYKYKNIKDYFKCNFNKIIKVFNKYMKIIKCVESQDGGNLVYKIIYYEKVEFTIMDDVIK